MPPDSSSPSSASPPSKPVSIGWLLAALVMIWLAPLGWRSLVTPDEGRYATIALHMAQTGDWLTPRLNGFLYFEKPPLVYWAGAISFRIFGINEFAARLWPALTSLGCIVAVGWAAQSWWGRDAAWRTIAVAASLIWIVANGHFLNLDSSLTFGLTLVLAGVLRAHAPTPASPSSLGRRLAMVLAWAGLSVATLSKGPVAIVVVSGALAVYSAHGFLIGDAAGVRRLWRGLAWNNGGLLFAVLTVPWFVLVSWRNPGFASFFFIHEHLLRYTSTAHRREGALWYFVPHLAAGALPWTTLVIVRALQALFARRRSTSSAAASSTLRPAALLWSWAGFVFVFFSFSGSKLPSYILPMFPALALLIAAPAASSSAAGEAFDKKAAGARLGWHALLPLTVWIALLGIAPFPERFAGDRTPVAVVESLLSHAAFAAVIFIVGALVAIGLERGGRRTSAYVAFALAHLVATLVFAQGHDRYAQLNNAKVYASLIADALPHGEPVFEVRMHDQSLPFYLRRDVTLVDYVDEFEFGERAEPGRMLPTIEAFSERWREAKQAAAVMTPDTYDLLGRAGLPMKPLFADARRIVVLRSGL